MTDNPEIWKGLVPGRDYEPSVCPNCGKDEHTNEELQACLRLLMPAPLLDEDGTDWTTEGWDEFTDRPNLCYRKDDDTFLFWGSPNDPFPRYIVTWETSEESVRNDLIWAWHVNGEFIYMENPFWLHDLAAGDPFTRIEIGGFLYWEGVN